MRFVTVTLAALGLLAGIALPAAAQDYPARMIRFVVPFAAGSATDTFARTVGQKLTALYGWQTVVENMAGASGQLAAQNVARAAPDGYTLLVTTNTTHAANQSLYKKLNYDHIADFEPIGKFGTITLALALHPSVPANTVAELVAYGKANPDKLTFGSGSSSSRIAGEMLKSLAGFQMTHVAYRSNPQAVTDVLGGQISLVFADVVTTLPQIKAGKLKGLGVSSVKRSTLAPDLPTMQEAGIKGYDLTAWFAIFAPAKTPQPVIAKLNQAFVAVVTDKAVAEALLAQGLEPETSTPAELAAFVVSETKKWAEIVKAAGIQPE